MNLCLAGKSNTLLSTRAQTSLDQVTFKSYCHAHQAMCQCSHDAAHCLCLLLHQVLADEAFLLEPWSQPQLNPTQASITSQDPLACPLQDLIWARQLNTLLYRNLLRLELDAWAAVLIVGQFKPASWRSTRAMAPQSLSPSPSCFALLRFLLKVSAVGREAPDRLAKSCMRPTSFIPPAARRSIVTSWPTGLHAKHLMGCSTHLRLGSLVSPVLSQKSARLFCPHSQVQWQE